MMDDLTLQQSTESDARVVCGIGYAHTYQGTVVVHDLSSWCTGIWYVRPSHRQGMLVHDDVQWECHSHCTRMYDSLFKKFDRCGVGHEKAQCNKELRGTIVNRTKYCW